MGQRKQFTAGFKAKIASEAIKGHRTAQEIGTTTTSTARQRLPP